MSSYVYNPVTPVSSSILIVAAIVAFIIVVVFISAFLAEAWPFYGRTVSENVRKRAIARRFVPFAQCTDDQVNGGVGCIPKGDIPKNYYRFLSPEVTVAA